MTNPTPPALLHPSAAAARLARLPKRSRGPLQVALAYLAGCGVGLLLWAWPVVEARGEKAARAGVGRDCQKEPACLAKLKSALQVAKTDRDAALLIVNELYAQYQDPRLLYNIARILHQLNRPKEAVDHYLRFINSGVERDLEVLAKARGYLDEAELEAMAADKPQPPAPAASPAGRPDATSGSGAVGGATTAASTSAAVPAGSEKPIYKKAWFWGLIGGVVAAGVVAGVTTAVVVQKYQIPDNVYIYQAGLRF